MKAWTTEQAINQAASTIGVRVIELRQDGKAFRFRLAPNGEKLETGSKKYQLVRSGISGTRKVHAVCWHGHRDFFRQLFALDAQARVLTCRARYTAENFERTHGRTDGNIGSMMYPLQYSEACDCAEAGLGEGE